MTTADELCIDLGAVKRTHDIPGAPFRIGMRVRVLKSPADELVPHHDAGKFGKIVYYEYDCGCGQTFPDDPMIGVRLGRRVQEFWPAELADASGPLVRSSQ